MKHLKIILLSLTIVCQLFGLQAQENYVSKKKFFTDEDIIRMTLKTDLKSLSAYKTAPEAKVKQVKIPATVVMNFPDNNSITTDIECRPRGNFRRETCQLPPVMLNFKPAADTNMSKWGSVKLVWPCGRSEYDDQLIIKEYIVYKMYELFTPISFRVRLARLSIEDSRGKSKPDSVFAFMIEDVDDMAKRNDCREIDSMEIHIERTKRTHATMVAIVQFMLGNTDWSVMKGHNVKMVQEKKDTTPAYVAVPYDFDYCGMVNAKYAIPNEQLEIEKVTDRYYMGYERTQMEVDLVLKECWDKRAQLTALIENNPYLNKYNKNEMKMYLNEFYSFIGDKRNVEQVFVKVSRRR